MSETFIITLKHIGYVLAFIIGAVGLPIEAFTIFGVLVVIDTITGVIRAIKFRGGQAVSSLKLTSGIVSKMLIILVPLIIAWAGRGAGIPMLPLANGALSMLILAEAYSILGNIHSIYCHKDLKEFDAIAFVVEKVKKMVETILTNAGDNKPR